MRATRVLACASLAGALAAASLGACTSNDATPSPPAAPRECPASLASAVGAACNEGQSCPITYPCGDFSQLATCTCTGGHFACNDATDASLAPGAAPSCVKAPPAGTCPATEPTLAPCTTVGIVCTYTGVACAAGEAPAIDTCQCVGGGDAGLRFECDDPCARGADGGGDADARADARADADAGGDAEAGPAEDASDAAGDDGG